ncbi:hypothetical protein SAMN05518871_10284 [Psychrobacillus sp. OK028]|uniref:hypothetical protein n=1 Tax=Psychrobacillus sp. OK028 TaxID=1884359 RepID=UPI00087FF745|nr:hypothetical protein [Psychrobacillus sp. OK028]SDM72108.1 hypothetical protein SAMN05518871_10284 [Psychrobacillus sp. OK028]
MNFPIIHTNFWDALIAVPAIMILTQLLKVYFKIPSTFTPYIALLIGLLISIFISHPNNLFAGIFMGWFYGYAAVGNYAALKTSWVAYRNE